MHIFEGVLSVPVLVGGAALTVAGLALGLRKINADNLPKVAVMTATFFTASFIHIPVGPTSVHLMLNGLVGLLLGWAAFPVVFVGLLIQAILFQFGGITTLGVNTFNVAGPGLLFGLLFRNMVLNGGPQKSSLGAFLAGALALGLTSVLVAAVLILTNPEKMSFQTPAVIQMFFHGPVMVLEGFIALFCVRFLKKVKPELLYNTLNNQTFTPSAEKEI